MLHKPILIILGDSSAKELANEDLKTAGASSRVLSLGCGQNNLKLGSFPQHKKVITGQSTTTRTLSETQSLGDKKEQENTVTNFVQSSVY